MFWGMHARCLWPSSTYVCLSNTIYHNGTPYVCLVDDDVMFLASFLIMCIPSLGRLGRSVVGIIWEWVSVML